MSHLMTFYAQISKVIPSQTATYYFLLLLDLKSLYPSRDLRNQSRLFPSFCPKSRSSRFAPFWYCLFSEGCSKEAISKWSCQGKDFLWSVIQAAPRSSLCASDSLLFKTKASVCKFPPHTLSFSAMWILPAWETARATSWVTQQRVCFQARNWVHGCSLS